MAQNIQTISLSELGAAVKGRVIGPEDAGYDEARVAFVGGIDKHPAAIVRVADAADIAAVVKIARETGAELAIRSGGHSGSGHSISEGGIVIDLAEMKAIEFDVPGRTAWAQTGVTAGEFTAAAAEHGLAVGFGDTGSVGIGGITLGGGVGFLVRKYGLTIDSLLAAEIVTADGQLLSVDEKNHPDLFWALRGGGGNFGVVTRFKYRLQEVDQIVGGMLFSPATVETITKFVALAESAPEELSTIINVMLAPPMPFLPEDVIGKPIVMAFIVCVGDLDAAEKIVAPFKEVATPYADMVKRMRYVEMYPPEEGEYHPIAASRSLFMDKFDAASAELILKRIAEPKGAQMAVTQVRVLGGAMTRVAADATAYAHRDRPIMANVAALFATVEEAAASAPWADKLTAELSGGKPGVYVNFLGSEGEARVREAYPGKTWDRLAAVKKQYDPDNLFRLNQNITPQS